MRTETDITCPLSGSKLVHTGQNTDGYVHFYESSTNQGIRYRRYRLDWTVLELRGGAKRFFHINGSETIEVEKVGDKWLTLTATEEEKQLALDEWKKRTKHVFETAAFPTIKNIGAVLGSDVIQPVLPQTSPTGKIFELQYVFNEDPIEARIIDPNARPNVSVDICPLVEYITGKVGLITEDNLEEMRKMYDDDDIEIGDTIYAWDMGGWEAMAGRSGETIFRDNEYVASKLLKMS